MEIIAEFVNAGTILTFASKFLKFSSKYVPGSKRPFVTSTDLFVELIIIQKKGKIEMIEDTNRNK